MNMALLHTAEYRYFVRIEVTPHTRSLSNFSEFTYTVLQAGSISEKSCAQVVASPRYSEPQRKNIDTSIAMSPCRHAGAADNYHWCDFNTGSVGSDFVATGYGTHSRGIYCTRLYVSCRRALGTLHGTRLSKYRLVPCMH